MAQSEVLIIKGGKVACQIIFSMIFVDRCEIECGTHAEGDRLASSPEWLLPLKTSPSPVTAGANRLNGALPDYRARGEGCNWAACDDLRNIRFILTVSDPPLFRFCGVVHSCENQTDDGTKIGWSSKKQLIWPKVSSKKQSYRALHGGHSSLALDAPEPGLFL